MVLFLLLSLLVVCSASLVVVLVATAGIAAGRLETSWWTLNRGSSLVFPTPRTVLCLAKLHTKTLDSLCMRLTTLPSILI